MQLATPLNQTATHVAKPQRTTALDLVRHGSTAILKPVNVSVEKVTTECVTYHAGADLGFLVWWGCRLNCARKFFDHAHF